ncbi:AP2/ERF domain protein [Vibrio phage 1.152.O._10N.222.46.E1]|uniref:AP2/ERF domain protein n=5 Tax=Nahantvirus 49C7 TaxID=2846601 RepID=A0A2I7RBE0_9CAUD|nr:HNH endonuclease [Vibrio phage 1.026.O._10N.222.49.C7]AUR82518.1 AP2/ERF domain protein [Vibrio phage 1.025.O._10N.222.46.B6]AUR90768.1 AP2/ERF domain protein [Vibrio phage 1.150.O._10N.222.46.A6]AUR90941.1 AP2/ERF domain protein [Vibrio phage 1.152.O._10N.222.46.E1]AUS02409.1 AP2/ERF domain protein [Vibrio phage 2.130.O._10N.222.46.C2]AUR82626.1 AP2/ERF domain protein [Vibrio phage 1.026.O._10N.222.49.C7]
MSKLVCGVGVNDSDSPVCDCPYYTRWASMLNRCYGGRKVSHDDCEVCEDWKTFSNFKDWMKNQDWKHLELDKDLRVPNSRTYSPDTCMFIPQRINTMFVGMRTPRGKYPVGVRKLGGKRNKPYSASCFYEGKRTYLGSFTSPEEAAEAYLEHKQQLAYKEAVNTSNPLLRDALLKYINSGELKI